jgi:hypothetical protein
MQAHIASSQQVQIQSWSLLKKQAKMALKFKNRVEVKPGRCQSGTQIQYRLSISISTLIFEKSVSKKQLWNEEKRLSNENRCMKRKIQKLMSGRMKVRWGSMILNF